MEHGFIHEKLDIKILILFILGRLGEPVDIDTLTDLTFVDAGIGYFDFSECVAELLNTGHITETDGRLSITDKGLRNGQVAESRVPYSVRRRAEKKTAALVKIQRRNAMVKAEKENRLGGGLTVALSLSDGLGEILSMNIYAANDTQATAMVEAFTKQAEQIYGQVVALLVDEPS
ncbi:MAG: DUF4364 family protein [Oscillospiraceae bacterium]|nr:DUF4364 family protein [Oscillospiraceae bacterium]